ncbi:uncharacterized protein HD556DRAFT_1309424 [Suillus plorans]|uniref:Uncharacterized protein n=1 Tax=Suillus plorans TaxID=116603 RepID=A0A9P7DH20_9AGAM|nr:uncharacterized protein HD556DRAFT_1309424 [Suillus plorans]KAG1792361.1 hypothetical protein HD556DRAFT_1309424 [Suillus plorans]
MTGSRESEVQCEQLANQIISYGVKVWNCVCESSSEISYLRCNKTHDNQSGNAPAKSNRHGWDMVWRIGSVYRPQKGADDLRMTQMSVQNSWKSKRSVEDYNVWFL